MNWYKIAKQYATIAIVSYSYDGTLGIVFNGGKKYIYENINIDNYGYLNSLLKNRNYRKAQEILKSWSSKNEETDEDRQEILNELYDRDILK